jgi:hypothetical protein
LHHAIDIEAVWPNHWVDAHVIGRLGCALRRWRTEYAHQARLPKGAAICALRHHQQLEQCSGRMAWIWESVLLRGGCDGA